MSRRHRLIALTTATVLVVAACGGDDGGDATTPTTEAPETTSAPTTEATTTTSEPAETTTTTEAPETTTTTEAPEPGIGTLLDVAAEAGEFSTLLAAIEVADLTEELSTRRFTLLAPTDTAFEALGQEAIDALIADPDQLRVVLQDHLLPLPQTVSDIALFGNVLAIGGSSWTVDSSGELLRIGAAQVVLADVEADNGFLQGLDAVLVAAPAE